MSLIKCSKCGKEVSNMAEKCIYCGNVINPDAVDTGYACDNCGAPVSEKDNVCYECGLEFDGAEQEEVKSNSNCVVDNIAFTSSENFLRKSNTFLWFFVGGLVGFLVWLFTFGLSTTGDEDAIFGAFFFLTFGFALICSVISAVNNSSNTNKRNEFLKLCEKRINKIVNGDESYVSLTADLKGLSINKKNKTVTVYNGLSVQPVILKYEDILSFELIEDGSQEIQGKGAETYLAGRYLGPYAALAVASGSRNINQFCNQLVVEIHLVDVQEKNISIEMIGNCRINKANIDYRTLKPFSKNLVTTLDKIMREIDGAKQKKQEASNKEIVLPKAASKDIPSLLREYKKLLDDGIITEKEFNDKKKELLNKKDE